VDCSTWTTKIIDNKLASHVNGMQPYDALRYFTRTTYSAD